MCRQKLTRSNDEWLYEPKVPRCFHISMPASNNPLHVLYLTTIQSDGKYITYCIIHYKLSDFCVMWCITIIKTYPEITSVFYSINYWLCFYFIIVIGFSVITSQPSSMALIIYLWCVRSIDVTITISGFSFLSFHQFINSICRYRFIIEVFPSTLFA